MVRGVERYHIFCMIPVRYGMIQYRYTVYHERWAAGRVAEADVFRCYHIK